MSRSTAPRSVTTAPSTRQQLDELDALLQRMLELPVNQVEEPPAEAVAPSPPAETPAPPEAEPSPDRIPLPPLDYPPSFMVVETAAPRLDPAHPAPALRMEMRRRDLDDAPPAAEAPVEPAPAADPPGFFWMQPDAESRPAPAPPEREEWVPLKSSWQPSDQTWQPLAESWQHAQGPREPASDAAAEAVTEAPAPVYTAPDTNLRFTPDVPAPTREEGPARPEPTPPPSPSLQPADDPLPDVAPRGGPLVWFDRCFEACLSAFGPPGRWLCEPVGRAVLGGVGLLCLAAAAAVMVADGVGWWPW